MGRIKFAIFLICSGTLNVVSCTKGSKICRGNMNASIDHPISWNDLLKQDVDHYLVLVYSETCAHCKEVLDSNHSFPSDTLSRLFCITFDSSISVLPNPEFTIGASNTEDVWIYAVPTLIEIKDQTVINNVYGSDEVLSLLYSFKI